VARQCDAARKRIRCGAAALFFNLMPMVGVEGLVATPDAPEMAAAAFLLYALARSPRPKTACGGSQPASPPVCPAVEIHRLLSRLGILVWLAAVPKERRWFLSFWPYLGGAIALLMFVPVILWNAQHGWVSFALQFGRVESGGFTLRFLGEFLAGQIGLATPFIAILASQGQRWPCAATVTDSKPSRWAAAMILPATLYFVWHSLHDRVQGNWPSFFYPALAIAAAGACLRLQVKGASSLLRVSRVSAIPFAVVMIAAVYAQALFDIVPIREPVSRLLAFNMAPWSASLRTFRRSSMRAPS